MPSGIERTHFGDAQELNLDSAPTRCDNALMLSIDITETLLPTAKKTTHDGVIKIGGCQDNAKHCSRNLNGTALNPSSENRLQDRRGREITLRKRCKCVRSKPRG